MIKVTILGSGNVGFHLVNLFNSSSNIILNEWYSRSVNFDERVKVINEIENLSESDIYVICISDKSITQVSNKIQFKNKLVVHTSGSTPYSSLNNKNRRGVFYPLQTFSKSQKLNYSEIPICIEAENDIDLETLKKLSLDLNCKYYEINFEERKTLHLAAIISNNFTNFLFGISKEIIDSKKLDFDILKPLINETVNKIHKLDPIKAQTGPARRNDVNILKMHENMLKNEEIKSLYKFISKMIKEKYGN
tara:strand:+ start:2920 stop:3666 length:747 start_codon:yes stop_codon:yes gene_type:complete